jgi:hypothetical protein
LAAFTSQPCPQLRKNLVFLMPHACKI